MLCLTQHLEWHMEMACHRLESATIWVQGQKGLGSRWCEKSTVQSRQRPRDEGSRKFQGTLRFVLRLRALHWELCNSADSNLCLNLAPLFIKTYESRHIKTYQDISKRKTPAHPWVPCGFGAGSCHPGEDQGVGRRSSWPTCKNTQGHPRTPKRWANFGQGMTRMDKEDGQGWQVCCVTLKWGFWGNGWKRGWKRPYASIGIFEVSLRRMRSVWILRFELKNLSTGGCHLCPATAGQPLVKEYRGQQVANKLNWAGSPPCRKTKECGKDTLSANDAHGTSRGERVCIASKHFWRDLYKFVKLFCVKNACACLKWLNRIPSNDWSFQRHHT